MQILILFLYSIDEQTENEIKEEISYTGKLYTIKYLRINVTKEMKDLQVKNYKNLQKKTQLKEKDRTKGKRHPMSMD